MILDHHVQFAAQVLGRRLHMAEDSRDYKIFELFVQHARTTSLVDSRFRLRPGDYRKMWPFGREKPSELQTRACCLANLGGAWIKIALWFALARRAPLEAGGDS
jgi:hypothetical protein